MNFKLFKKWRVFAISLVIVFSVAFIGSIFTSQGTETSYYEKVRPEITPPSIVFPIVWNILFLLIAISLSLSWINSKGKDKSKVIFLFAINFILNILWSFFYFGIQSPFLAFFDLIFLWLSIISLIVFNSKVSKISGWLLVPYFLWVSFAGILNYLSI